MPVEHVSRASPRDVFTTMTDDLHLAKFNGLCRLFPLPGVVLFPHAVLPLHIFEPRYRRMTEDALASDRLVTMVQIRPEAATEGPENPAIEEIACIGKIVSHERLPDGRYYLLLHGVQRVRILHEVEAPTLYRQARVAVLSDEGEYDITEIEREDLIGRFRTVAQRAGGLSPELDTMLRERLPLGALTDLIAHALQLPPTLKQLFLADTKPARRAATLRGILRGVLDGLRKAAEPPFPPRFSAN
jgi:Lon protease-like protein